MSHEPTSANADGPDLTNKSVIKAMVLLRELGRSPQGITVTELAEQLGMSRPTAFRLLLSMEHEGFVERVDNYYTLGWEIAKLGRLADPSAGVAARVQPVLDDVAQEINETVSFALAKDQAEYDIIAEATSSRMLRVSHLYVHRQYPLHASATGKILLAELDDRRIMQILPRELVTYTDHTIADHEELLASIAKVRERGYSVMDNELEDDLFSVAVAVRDSIGAVLGVLTATGPNHRMKADGVDRVVTYLSKAAKETTQLLG
ncbi:IclR family transcriptional regulator [Arthrobacter pigmenti]